MNEQKITFGDKEISKKDFYSSMQAISLDSVDKSKTIVSKKWKINDSTINFFIGYLNEDIVRPLCIILPQMSGLIYKLQIQKYKLKKKKPVDFIDNEVELNF